MFGLQRATVRILAVVVMSSSAPAAGDPAPAASPTAAPGSVVGSVEPHRPGEPAVPGRPHTAPLDHEPTAADVAAAPLPGFESGRIDQGQGESESTWRIIGRGALFVPRLVIDAALSPLRGVLWVQEHYHVIEWYERIFWNDDETIGLYPTASVDTSLGVTAGMHFIDRDLFGKRERIELQAETSTGYRQIYAGTLSSGQRFGDRFVVELDAGYERRPHDAFSGIGNGDDAMPPAGMALIDPRFNETAVETHYRQARSRLSLTADLRTWRKLYVRASGAVSDLEFGPPDGGQAVTDRYDRRGVVGLDGFRYSYGELELRWDNRHGRWPMEPTAVPSGGSLAAAFAGRMHRLDDGPDFWRYGVDLATFLRIAEGPRVLSLRLHGEGVTGSRGEVPFTELPKLGGPTYLRGYELDEFRDRIAAFATVAYRWDLSQWVSASLFTDIGRVYPSLDELSLDRLRMGYGVSLEGHSLHSFLLEISLGSSLDGGVFANLSFNPVYDIDDRVRRR